MKNSSHLVRSPARFLSTLLVIAGLAIGLAMLLRFQIQRQALAAKKQAAIDTIQQHGGLVMFGPTDPAYIISVDLSKAVINAETLQALNQCTGAERLIFDGGSLRPIDCDCLVSLPQLRSLSLARTNVTDAHIARLPLNLSSLSLNGTSVTDNSLPYLAAMRRLANLDIASTDITADGLRKLEPLKSLQRLWIDETGISAESAQSLQQMQLKSVEVRITEGNGKRTHALLSTRAVPNVRGILDGKYMLWESDQAWGNTLAGVVDAVVSEVGLDSEQAARLLQALTSARNLRKTKPELPLSANTFSINADSLENGSEIASVDEFIALLQKNRWGFATRALIQYGKQNFTANDIPKLLAAMRTAPADYDNGLYAIGPFLLIHHGFGMPDVASELDRLLTHQAAIVRANTICDFGYGGARSFYSLEEWVPGEAADAFAIQRVLPILKDESEYDSIRSDAWVLLAEIVQRRPQYASEVMPVLIDALGEQIPSPYKPSVYLSRIVEVAPDAAIAIVPKLKTKLAGLDRQLVDASQAEPADVQVARKQAFQIVLTALAATASATPELAQEIAFEYLDRLRDGLPTGPFAPLLSPATPSVTSRVVVELLDAPPEATHVLIATGADATVGELESVAKKIRDWRADNGSVDN